MRIPTLFLAIAAATLPLTACGRTAEAEGPRVERTDSAGVEIVRTLGVADVPLAWRFAPVRTLGGAEEGPEAFFQVAPAGLDVDAAGNLYVLDYGSHRVVVFDAEGRHLRSLGRKGGGPGELEWPMSLSVLPDGRVSVYDLGKQALVQWTGDGTLRPSEPVEEAASPMSPRVVATAQGLVFARMSGDDGGTTETLVRTTGGQAEELARQSWPPAKRVDYGCIGLQMPPLFAPELVWDARGDRVVVSHGTAYALMVHPAAGRPLGIRRELPPRAATRALALAEVGEEGLKVRHPGGECRIAPERVVEGRGYAEVIPAIGNVALAPDGRIWVQRGTVKGEAAVIDLFAADGAYLGTLPAGAPVPAAFTPAGEVVAIEKDELDVPRLVVYRVAPDPAR
jgi:hypothetical protein